MPKEKVIVVGLGEVGRSMLELLRESRRFAVFGLDIDEKKMRALDQSEFPLKADIMHICIPCTNPDMFVNVVVDYISRFKPNLVIINSTVTPGTTSNINRANCSCLIAHSPVRGVHKSLEHMKWELRRWIKYIGGINPESGEAASKHFQSFGLKTKILNNCLETELAKLFETTYRAWMIACFQEMHRVSSHLGADFDMVVDFLEDTHRVRLDRPIMYPGVIGGHCLVPNTELLLKSYDSAFLHLILKSNEKRKKEIRDESVRMEVEKVRKRVEM